MVWVEKGVGRGQDWQQCLQSSFPSEWCWLRWADRLGASSTGGAAHHPTAWLAEGTQRSAWGHPLSPGAGLIQLWGLCWRAPCRRAPAGQQRETGALALAEHLFILAKAARSSSGPQLAHTEQYFVINLSSFPHEELRKQRSEPALIHHHGEVSPHHHHLLRPPWQSAVATALGTRCLWAAALLHGSGSPTMGWGRAHLSPPWLGFEAAFESSNEDQKWGLPI